MKGQKYIAWLDGQSVAVGGMREVEEKARAIFASEQYQAWRGDKPVELKITTYGKQLFRKAVVLGR